VLALKKDTSRIYAMKILDKSRLVEADEVEGTKMEKEVLRKVNHPFIVGLKFSFQTTDKLYLILDYVNGGELFTHLRRARKFDESLVRFYAVEIVLALEYLHKCLIVYRDLKPENILITADGHICLTDFGLAKANLPFGELTYTFCGTAEYLAPEILDGKGYDKAVDWWSLGTLIYEMLTGKPPFYASHTLEMYRKILSEELKFPDYVSQKSRALLLQLLERDPNKRIGSDFDDAEEIKTHQFFEGVQWMKFLSREIDPPFKPPVRDPMDISQFDERFTNQSIQESPAAHTLTDREQQQFKDFSYTDNSEIARN